MPAKNKLKEKHLKMFEHYVKKWAEYFGIYHRWEHVVKWNSEKEDAFGKWACVHYKVESRIAAYFLSKKNNSMKDVSEEQLAISACHEVVHVLIAPIVDRAEDGTPRSETTNDIEHEVVHTLVKIAMRDAYTDLKESCPVEF